MSTQTKWSGDQQQWCVRTVVISIVATALMLLGFAPSALAAPLSTGIQADNSGTPGTTSVVQDVRVAAWNTGDLGNVTPRTAAMGQSVFNNNLNEPLFLATVEQLSTKPDGKSLTVDQQALCARVAQLQDPKVLNQAVDTLKDRVTNMVIKPSERWYTGTQVVPAKGTTCATVEPVVVKKALGDFLAVSFSNNTAMALNFDGGITPVTAMTTDEQAKVDPALKQQLDAKTIQVKAQADAQNQADATRQHVIDAATSKLGKTIYVWGGKNFTANQVDCSGFTGGAFEAAGIKGVPKSTAGQTSYGTAINVADIKPGDLVVYNSSASPSGGHSAIYIGNGKIIENPGTGIAVRTSPLIQKGMPIRTIRRVINDAPAVPVVVNNTPPVHVVDAAVVTVKGTSTPPSQHIKPTSLVIPGLNAKQLQDWSNIASCESTYRWDIVASNGHYGGIQFSPATWNYYKKGITNAASANLATIEDQIRVGEATLKGQGWGAWACAKRFGLSGKTH